MPIVKRRSFEQVNKVLFSRAFPSVVCDCCNSKTTTESVDTSNFETCSKCKFRICRLKLPSSQIHDHILSSVLFDLNHAHTSTQLEYHFHFEKNTAQRLSAHTLDRDNLCNVTGEGAN